jgi:energy-converting hydrogenase Eha subunit H
METPDITDMTSKPAMYFARPEDIVESDKLQPGDKLAALREWEFDVRQQAVATEENMAATAAVTLQDVHNAMRALGHEPDNDTSPGGKAG